MLEPIVESTRRRIDRLTDRAGDLRDRAADRVPSRSMTSALRGGGLSVIAEVKRRSPSRGDLDLGLDPGSLAATYASSGAAAISVLTEPDHFSGSNDDLVTVRSVIDLPVLRKDFTLEPIQVWEAASIGADAILLILAILDDGAAAGLLEEARRVGLDVVVEVHDEGEAQRALGLGAEIIGINNRDLRTFDVDLETTERIAPLLPEGVIVVGESGVHGVDDARRLREAGCDAVLVGESLVRSSEPAALLGALTALP